MISSIIYGFEIDINNVTSKNVARRYCCDRVAKTAFCPHCGKNLQLLAGLYTPEYVKNKLEGLYNTGIDVEELAQFGNLAFASIDHLQSNRHLLYIGVGHAATFTDDQGCITNVIDEDILRNDYVTMQVKRFLEYINIELDIDTYGSAKLYHILSV